MKYQITEPASNTENQRGPARDHPEVLRTPRSALRLLTRITYTTNQLAVIITVLVDALQLDIWFQ